MNRRTELREVNKKTLELLITALRILRTNKTEKFTARDIQTLTDDYVLANTIEKSISNDWYCHSFIPEKRVSLIGKALVQAFPNERVKIKRYEYKARKIKVTYISDDGEIIESPKYVHTYAFEYDD